MNDTSNLIDKGKLFNFGKTSADYAQFRDIYPQAFYQKLLDRHLCLKGQTVLDVGTGTGVLPRNLYRYGATWIGTDLSENQIKEARRLSSSMDIAYYVMPTEQLDFKNHSFDVITACQCFWYFHHAQVIPKFLKLLKPNGRLVLLYMAWLPFEDQIASESEKLVLKYNPDWSGSGEFMHPITIPDCYYQHFEMIYHEEYPLNVSFTRESWHGRMKTCRGIGASLSKTALEAWEAEHLSLLNAIAPPKFIIKHYGAIAELKKR